LNKAELSSVTNGANAKLFGCKKQIDCGRYEIIVALLVWPKQNLPWSSHLWLLYLIMNNE